MSYDKQRIVDAIWQNPAEVIRIDWEMKGGCWQSGHKPDGTAGSHHRSDRTKLERATDGLVYVHVHGEYPFQDGNIWKFLKQHWSTNDFYEVLQRAAEAYGIEPDYNGYTAQQVERAKQWRTEKELLKIAADYVTAALNTDAGTPARDYLQGRGLQTSERLGAWSKDIRSALTEHLQKRGNITATQAAEYIAKWLPFSPDDYNVAIPYTNGSAVVGFCLRRTTNYVTYTDKNGQERTKPKYLFSKDMPKGGYCEALKGGDAPVYLVEGLLDAEALKQAGFYNVMALGGMTPTDNTEDANKSQIQTLQRYNVKKVYYVPDCEYNEDGTRKTDATLRTIKALQPHIKGTLDGQGFVSVAIVDLETADSRRDKTKVDADTFLQINKDFPQAAFNEVVGRAKQWYEYELQNAVTQYGNDYATLCAKAADIYQSIENVGLRQRLKTDITEAKGGYLYELKAAGLNAAAMTAIDTRGTAATWAAGMAEIAEDMKHAHTPESMAAVLTRANRIQQADTYRSFEAQINTTREELHRAVAAKPDYLQTSWELWKGEGANVYSNRHISFAPSAVSIVAAPTNHGKTLFLLQTAINAAKATHKKIIYLSFENDIEQLYVRALAANMGELIGKAEIPNLRGEIRKYIKAADMPTELFFTDALGRHSIDMSEQIDKYWRKVAPNLRLARGNSDIDAVVNAVTQQVEQWRNAGIEAGGVFIDYLQLLHYPAMRAHSRTDEVKGICDRLNDMAKATALPVILAAQLNRDATKAGGDKLDGIELANIGESAGIENIAEDVYLLWQVDKINKDDKAYKPQAGGVIDIQPYLRRSWRCFGSPTNAATLKTGHLYIENLKARDYATGGYCLLPFNGAAGAITSAKSLHAEIMI